MGLNFPVALFREIEPLSNKYFNYNRNIIFDEIVYYSDQPKNVEEKYYIDEMKFIASMDVSDYLDNIQNIFFQHGQMAWFDKLKEIFEKYPDVDEKIINTIMFAFIVVETQKVNDQRSVHELTDKDYIIDHYSYYQKNVRPEMLDLFMFLKKVSAEYGSPTSKNPEPITIKCGKEKVIIDNPREWLTWSLTKYLDKYLGVATLEEAEEEMKTVYSNRGRKSNELNDRMLMGVFRLLTDYTNLKNKKEVLELTLRILNFWEKVYYEGKANYFKVENIDEINSVIYYLDKNNYLPTAKKQYKFSPNNNPFPPKEDLSGLSREERNKKMMQSKYIGDIECW